MPGYVLDGTGQVDLPQRPLAVTVDAVNTAVEVWAFGPDGTQSRQVLHPRPGLMILPRVDADTVVVARTPSGEEFPQGTVLHATIGVDSERDPDPERAELTPVDVSGLYSVELASVAPAGSRLTVTARKTVVDEVLSELASQARSAARRALRVDRLPEGRRVLIELDVDTTMSMLPRITDGSIGAIADVVAGIAAVVGARDGVQVNLIGRAVTTLPPGSLRETAEQVQAALDYVGLGVGFRPAAVDRSSRTERTLVVTVTDAVPAQTVCDGDEAPVVSRRHVLLSAALDDPADGFTVLAPAEEGRDASEWLLTDPARLRRIVASLLGDVAEVRESEGVLR